VYLIPVLARMKLLFHRQYTVAVREYGGLKRNLPPRVNAANLINAAIISSSRYKYRHVGEI